MLVGHMHREDVRILDGRLLVGVGPVSSPGAVIRGATRALPTQRARRWLLEGRRVIYGWAAAAWA